MLIYYSLVYLLNNPLFIFLSYYIIIIIVKKQIFLNIIYKNIYYFIYIHFLI